MLFFSFLYRLWINRNRGIILSVLYISVCKYDYIEGRIGRGRGGGAREERREG